MSLRLLAAGLIALALPLAAHAQGVGVTPDGRKGHIHIVVPGDTLWDITAHYLGTPWVWPSIWNDNEEVANPHLINPGDLIWITEGEMRKLTAEEAELLLAGAKPAPEPEPVPEPAKAEPESDPFAPLDAENPTPRKRFGYAGLHRVSFVTSGDLDASGAVLGTHEPTYWMSQQMRMITSLGEGQADLGDRYSVYRVRHKVTHPTTGRLVGYFVESVGTIEIEEVHPESSFAMVTVAYSEIEPGDRLAPYREEEERFAPVAMEQPISGMVLAQQPHRIAAGDGDIVVLDRGSEDGLTPGNELEIFRAGQLISDPIHGGKVQAPDHVIGSVFVLKTSRETSVALVTAADLDINAGDLFRNTR